MFAPVPILQIGMSTNRVTALVSPVSFPGLGGYFRQSATKMCGSDTAGQRWNQDEGPTLS